MNRPGETKAWRAVEIAHAVHAARRMVWTAEAADSLFETGQKTTLPAAVGLAVERGWIERYQVGGRTWLYAASEPPPRYELAIVRQARAFGSVPVTPAEDLAEIRRRCQVDDSGTIIFDGLELKGFRVRADGIRQARPLSEDVLVWRWDGERYVGVGHWYEPSDVPVIARALLGGA